MDQTKKYKRGATVIMPAFRAPEEYREALNEYLAVVDDSYSEVMREALREKLEKMGLAKTYGR